MPITADITPVDDSTYLAFDLLKKLVAEIRKSGGAANFINGWDGETLVDRTINLYPSFWEDSPDDAGMVWAQEDDALGSEPFRKARGKVILRCKNDPDTASPQFSGAKKVHAAAKAIEDYFRPSPGHERTMDELPSGRIVLAYENVVRSSAGRDASGRDQVAIDFDMRIQEAGTP